MAQVVGRKCHVEAVVRPSLRCELEIACVQEHSAQWWDLAGCNTPINVGGSRANTGEVGQIERYDIVLVGIRVGARSKRRLEHRGCRGVAHGVNAMVARELACRNNLRGHSTAQAAIGARQENGALARAALEGDHLACWSARPTARR